MPYASPRTVRWEYRLQRLGFVCFLGLTIAAAFGLLGDRARAVANSAAIYLLLLLIFRIAGRRTLSQTTTFDFVLLLIIGETTQQAMVGSDDSVATAAVAIMSLVSIDMTMTYLKQNIPLLDRLLEGDPVLLIEEGSLRKSELEANGLSEQDVAEAARLEQGLCGLDEVRQATLEKDGKISIVPWRQKPKS